MAFIKAKKRTAKVFVLASICLILFSCGDASSKSQDLGSSGVSASSSTTSAMSSLNTPKEVADAISGGGVPCTQFEPKVQNPNNPPVTLLPEPPSNEGICKSSDVLNLGITVFDTEDGADTAMSQIKTVYGAMMKSFGVKSLAFVRAGQDNRVWITISSSTSVDPDVSPEQEALLKEVAKVLNGKFEKISL